jgi:hypothetical protein
MKPKHLHTPMSLLAPSEIKLAKQCANMDFAAPAVAAILNERNTKGHTVTKQQINQMKRLEKQLKSGDLNPDATTAQKLIHAFGQRDDVSFVNIMFHKNHGLLLVQEAQGVHKVFIGGPRTTLQRRGEARQRRLVAGGVFVCLCGGTAHDTDASRIHGL